MVAWVLRESGEQSASIPRIGASSKPAAAGRRIREWLGVGEGEQLSWKSLKVAFDEWRARLGAMGVLVFQLQLGKEGIRGFSAYDDMAPLIAVNTAENYAARIFTIFHELCHLVSRTDSACGQVSIRSTR
ncbi:MAG: ImmA/IrrE family metallo-endopeptidase, partial [Planctomycetota bacterium]